MNNFSFIPLEEKSDRGHYYFPEEGCLYMIKTTSATTQYLICSQATCQCRAKVADGVMMRTNGLEHEHENHVVQMEFETAFAQIRKQVKSDTQAS
jgi:hypothetical protein